MSDGGDIEDARNEKDVQRNFEDADEEEDVERAAYDDDEDDDEEDDEDDDSGRPKKKSKVRGILHLMLQIVLLLYLASP